MITPFLISCTSIIITRSIIAMSSTNWLFIWAALELNLLRFIPILIHSKNAQETEATVKYFLVQALGSSMLLIRRMSIWFNLNTPNQLISTILLIALILKIGIVPCHIWYPSVITSISWIAALILSTWQKLAPLIIISFTFSSSLIFIILSLARMNAIFGGLVGINQSHLRTIIAYSSITHIGWIIRLIAIYKPVATLLYFSIYSLIISPMFIIMHVKNIINRIRSNKLISHSKSFQFIIPLLLLSLRGLPPLTGFIPKWITIRILTTLSPITTLILIMGALINAYFYLNITFNFLLRIKKTNLITSSPPSPSIHTYLTLLASITLFTFPILIVT